METVKETNECLQTITMLSFATILLLTRTVNGIMVLFRYGTVWLGLAPSIFVNAKAYIF